jgi:hypothetical protein
MNGYAFLEQDNLFDITRSKIAENGNLPATAGTFFLRRSHYFNETRAQPGLLLNQTGVVISFEKSAHKHRRSLENVFYKHRRT